MFEQTATSEPAPPPGRRSVEGAAAADTVARTFAARDSRLAGQSVLVMCSGGVDSVVLTDIVATLPRGSRPARIELLWCDHSLRDTGTDHEAAAAVAARHGLMLHVRRAGRELGSSGNVQSRARQWRYAQAAELSRELSADVILTGHTADDQLETMLYGLVASSGSRALSGIPFERRLEGDGARVLRPLIEVSRAQVLEHARAQGLAWSEDPSNADPDTGQRVHIRHRVVPELLAVHPGAGVNLQRTAEIALSGARAADDLAQAFLSTHGDSRTPLRLDARQLVPLGIDAQRAVCASWLRQAGAGRSITASVVAAVVQLAATLAACEGGGGGRPVAMERACVRADGYHLVFAPTAPVSPEE